MGAVVVVAGVAGVASGVFDGHSPNAAGRRSFAAQRPAQRPLRRVYNPPPAHSDIGSSEQQADNAKIAQAAAGNSATWAAIAGMALPADAPSPSFPAIPHTQRQNPDSYTTAFVTELLNIRFATSARSSLLSWAVSEISPETTPGTPASAAGKFLYADLISSSSPVPTATAWTKNAVSGVTWSVSDVTVSVASQWSQALAWAGSLRICAWTFSTWPATSRSASQADL